MHNLSHSSHTLPVLAAALLAVSFEAPLSAQWANVSPGSGPAARYDPQMAYDSQRNVSVLFGGYDDNFALLGDTWEWNGSSWTQVATSGPPARAGHDMAYDSQRNRTVLFGGYNSSFSSIGDTWEWNGSSWSQVASTGPSVRSGHALAYDSQRNVTVLFGGNNGSTNLSDTWEWNGSSWTQGASTGPAARNGHAMAYDRQRNVTVLFGGIDQSLSSLGDTWAWNGSSWTQVANTGPTARRNPAMAYDSQKGVTVLFGGATGPGQFAGDTWEWNGSAWTQTLSGGPSARDEMALAYDSQRNRTVMFGGNDGNLPQSDTWELRMVPSGVALYGSGCGSPPLTLLAASTPRMGSTASCLIGPVPAPYLGAVALGFSNTSASGVPLPFELTSLGLAGCFQRTSAEANPLPVAPGVAPGMLQFQLAIPNHASWVSAKLYLQAYCLAPGANPGGAITSNGIEWTIGTY